MTERPAEQRVTQPTILVVSPLYLPTEEGLAHYTTEFCRHLAKQFRVVVLTGTESARVGRGPGPVDVLGTVRRWTWLGPARALGAALHEEPDRVLIQFVPFMYARRGGINLSIVMLSLWLALRAKLRGNGDVQVMFHELWYPFSFRPKALFMHVAHRCMVFGLGVAGRDLFCATERFAGQVRRNLGPLRKKVHVLAVGSNLERDGRGADPGPLREDERLKIALFGSLHPSKNVPLVLRTLNEAARRGPRKLELTIIGTPREDLVRQVPELASWLTSEVEVTGPLATEAATQRLIEQDFLVAYFQDGVSGRRGSLLAALCEGVPVVTTWRDFSDDVFLDKPFVSLLPCGESDFAENLLGLLGSSERPFAGVDRREVRRFYDEHFSWSAVIQRYAALSGLDRAVSAASGGSRLPGTVP